MTGPAPTPYSIADAERLAELHAIGTTDFEPFVVDYPVIRGSGIDEFFERVYASDYFIEISIGPVRYRARVGARIDPGPEFGRVEYRVYALARAA